MTGDEPTAPVVVETTLQDLLEEANLAMAGMSVNNPHRRTVYKLGAALQALADRYVALGTERNQLFQVVEQFRQQEAAANEQSQIILA